MPMIEGSEWMVPHPQTMGELENNIRAIYKNMPPAAETDQPAYDLMFQAYRRIAGTEHMIQTNVMAAEMARMETSTISRVAIRQFSLPGITMSAAEQVSYSDSWLPSGPQTPQIVPTVEVMLRGETPQ